MCGWVTVLVDVVDVTDAVLGATSEQLGHHRISHLDEAVGPPYPHPPAQPLFHSSRAP